MGERARYIRGEQRHEAEEAGGIEPLALRAVRASVTKRKALISSADKMVARINQQLDGRGRDRQAPTPPDAPTPRRVESDVETEEVALLAVQRQKLAGLALTAASS